MFVRFAPLWMGTLLLFSACGRKKECSGIVLDFDSKQPIPNAKVGVHIDDIAEDTLHTDQQGRFSKRYPFPLFDSPEIRAVIKKPGYDTIVVVNPDKDTIFLSR